MRANANPDRNTQGQCFTPMQSKARLGAPQKLSATGTAFAVLGGNDEIEAAGQPVDASTHGGGILGWRASRRPDQRSPAPACRTASAHTPFSQYCPSAATE